MTVTFFQGERPMSVVYFIGMDVHGQTTDLCVKTRANGAGRRYQVKTTIPEIVQVIEQVRRPRKVVFEEGPMAGWLLRHLRDRVEEAVVSDPRKNALVAKDGDKDDPIDASKLCDLYIGGYVRKVHHPETLSREVARQTVGLYHERVAHRVLCGNKVIGHLKRWGVVVGEKAFQEEEDRPGLFERLEDFSEKKRVVGHVELLLASYDEAVRQEALVGREVVKLGRQEEQVVRWQEVPGIAWIRGMTMWVYLDTPWRFRSKQALWKYMGIGLVRERSGNGPCRVHVDQGANHVLKGMIIGAAQTVIMRQSGVLYERYSRWLESGLSLKNARRNLAREIALICWAMWKNGGVYDERLIGGPAPAL
jgi:transposase